MLRILAIGAHQDDCEFSVGGTLALCAARGDVIKIVSVTNGDKGHYRDEYICDPALLARRREAEARSAAAVIGAECATLGLHDGEVYVTRENTEALVRLIRNYQPDLVLMNRPVDYHRDHRYAARLILDATYMLTVPMMCPGTPHLDHMPVFAYWWDRFTEAESFRAEVVVPIDDVMETKVAMACCHESQVFEWLPYNAGTLDQIPTDAGARIDYVGQRMRERGARVRAACDARMRELGLQCEFAEAFQISEYGAQPGEGKPLFPERTSDQ